MGRRMGRTVKDVIDGDTFTTKRRVGKSNVIRMSRLNTPERGQRGYSGAKRRLSNMIGGKRVTMNPVARDRHGRTVADVFVRGARVSKKMKR